MNDDLETTFLVSGLKCESCVARAETALHDLLGCVSAKVDLATATATVRGNVDPQAVCMALGEAGYPSVVKSGSF